MYLFRPCIDIHQGKVKQIVGSSLKKNLKGKTSAIKENFVSQHQPTYFAQVYQKFNLSGGHVIMLSKNQTDKKRVKDLLEKFPSRFNVGGGMNASNAFSWLKYGAAKIIFSSYLFSSINDLEKKLKIMKNSLPREKIVIDLSSVNQKLLQGNSYYIATNSWNKISEIEINQKSLNWLGEYASEFLVHSVDREGKKKGIELDLIRKLTQSPIPCVYAGGVSNYQDIKTIKKIGKKKIFFTVGSALDLYGGPLSLSRVIEESLV